MHLTRRSSPTVVRVLMVAVLAWVLAVAAACGGGPGDEVGEEDPPGGDETALIPVRLSETVHSVFYAPQYAALTLGFFQDEGLDVDLRTAWGSDRGAAAVLSGEADIALAGPEPALYVHVQGSDDPLVIFSQLTATDGSFLLARTPMDNFSWDDVRGTVIVGGRPGGMPEMVLEYTLSEAGIEPHVDVEIITNLDFTAVPGAFAAGTGDFVGLFEPTASEFESQGIGHVVASMGLAGGPLPYTVFMARQGFIEDHPDVVQRFTNAVYRGMLWVEANDPETVAEAVAPHFPDTPGGIMVSVITRYKEQGSWAPSPVVDPDHFARLQDVMVAGGVLADEERVPYEAVIVTDFARRAMEAVSRP